MKMQRFLTQKSFQPFTLWIKETVVTSPACPIDSNATPFPLKTTFFKKTSIIYKVTFIYIINIFKISPYKTVVLLYKNIKDLLYLYHNLKTFQIHFFSLEQYLQTLNHNLSPLKKYLPLESYFLLIYIVMLIQ